MQFAGLVKNSFLDFPGYIAAVVFVPGCNMDCWYCHNKNLWKEENIIDPAEIEGFLESHKGFLDGVVVSGGEPTLQEDLEEFIRSVKSKGYLVKLDTNGTNPQTVKRLLPLLDYIAVDIKAPPGALRRAVSWDMDETPIWETADLLIKGAAVYEFRTTMMPLLDTEDIGKIAKRLQGAKRYAVQQYRKTDSVKLQPEPLKPEDIKKAAEAAREYISEVVVRGL
jgi:pyruvate formate lyase activating enzyme